MVRTTITITAIGHNIPEYSINGENTYQSDNVFTNLAGGNYYVYVVENAYAVQKNIKTGISQGEYTEVVSGLKAGEQVVVKGQNRLRDGVAVVVEGQVPRDESQAGVGR